MRIASLLPSLTELVATLGRGGDLVGVTHECDFPIGVERLPYLTRSRIPTSTSSAEIDAMVAEQGGQLYELDADLLTQLQPDLILTQSQCDVCAVSEATVRQVAATLPGSPHVESVNPIDLAGVHEVFRRVGDLIGAREEADRLVGAFQATAEEIDQRRRGRPVPRVLLLEWFDPPFLGGHWNPELIALAGGLEVLGRPGVASRRASWEEITASRPEVLILSPCGFTMERTESELPSLMSRPEWRDLPAVHTGRAVIVDGSAFFSRPGPRLESSLRIAAAAIDPDCCADLAPPTGWRRLLVNA